MMSRLALFPLLGSVILYMGRKHANRTHAFIGASIALLPAVSLLWSSSPVGGIPFAVRWFSFGLMVTGFSGCVNRYGLQPLLRGLSAAAGVTAALILFLGADSITGNPNRTGMVLALGFTASAAGFRKNSWVSWVLPLLILSGAAASTFITGWISCLIGGLALLPGIRRLMRGTLVVPLMIAGQLLLGFMPEVAGKIGPTLELRSRIWRSSASLFQENLPLGTGTGSARLVLFTSSEQELRDLAGENRRVDYLHSEPLSMAVESGIPGLLLVCFIVFWLLKRTGSTTLNALLLAFWPVFATDLPLATPLGALPAALFLGMVPGLSPKRISIHAFVPLTLAAISIAWGFLVVTGYSAMGGNRSPGAEELELACRRIPWEERAFLAAGHAHLSEGSVLSALEDADRFIELYPDYYRGWELKATALSMAGRESSSEWARSALLVTGDSTSADRFLMILNGIDPPVMNLDTALLLGRKLNLPIPGSDMAGIVRSMSGEQLFRGADKLLYLAQICREDSLPLAAGIWFTGLAFTVSANTDIPAATALGIFDGVELYQYLPEDWKQKADLYLDQLVEMTGAGPEALPRR